MTSIFDPDIFIPLFIVAIVFVGILLLLFQKIMGDNAEFKKLTEILSHTLMALGTSLRFMKGNEKHLIEIIREAIRKLELSENKKSAQEIEDMARRFIKERNSTSPVLNANFRKIAEDNKKMFNEFLEHPPSVKNIIESSDSAFIEPLSMENSGMADHKSALNLTRIP